LTSAALIFLRDRLQRRLKGLPDGFFLQLLSSAHQREGKQELISLLENLTVNETSFFPLAPAAGAFFKKSFSKKF